MKHATLSQIISCPRIMQNFTHYINIEKRGRCKLISVLNEPEIEKEDAHVVMLRPNGFTVISEQFKAVIDNSAVFNLKKDTTYN